MRGSKLGVILSLMLLTGAAGWGCAAPQVVDRYDFEAPEAVGLEAWLGGAAPAELGPDAGAVDRFIRGEYLYWTGDLEGAYEVYVGMLREEPGHPLNRFAASRLHGLRHDVISFSERVQEDLGEVRYDGESPLTRYTLARLMHFVQRDLWARDVELAEPFSFESAGVIPLWRATPRISPWRLQDFDREFEPETASRLSDRYRTPLVAAPHPANWRPVEEVYLPEPGTSMRLGRAGVYYLESFVEVDEGQQVLVSGNFPAATKVWIGDELILERREEGYEPGRVFRDVELSAGSHRVLMKMAFQPGYRDWFELYLVPAQGRIGGVAGIRSVLDPEHRPGRVAPRGEQRLSMELEPVEVPGDMGSATTARLFAVALAAYGSNEAELFDAAFEALQERAEGFAPLYLLASYQVRTRWDVPSELREARSLAFVRRSLEADPENLHALVTLERGIRDQSNDREHRQVLERSLEIAKGSNGSLRQLRPMVVWAGYLEQKGWETDAEAAWKEVLEREPGNCLAARQVQRSYERRRHMTPLEAITAEYRRCPTVLEHHAQAHPERLEEALELARRQAARNPYSAGLQRELAEQLRGLDRSEEALAVLAEARRRMPYDEDLVDATVDLLELTGELDEARRLIDEHFYLYGRSGSLALRRASLDDEIPLRGLLRDGQALAAREVARGDAQGEEELMALDDAYYVHNFQGREHLEDGSVWTLTHQIVRVMTRGAIDRYAEISVPSGSQLLLARTIKASGEARAPEDIPGKSTLSMPGLAEGDFVELAYLQFSGPTEVASHVDGPTFFFQNLNISSRQSELVLLNVEDLSIETANSAPAAEEMEWEGRQGLRFIARDVRRPRAEPRRVSAVEFLPWVREYRKGVEGLMLDAERRYHAETIRDSARPSTAARQALRAWAGTRSLQDDEDVRRLFYAVSDHFRSPSPGTFSIDAAHALEHRRGSPLVLMRALLDLGGVENDLYLGRSDGMPPTRQPVGEIRRFQKPLLRVVMPQSGQVVWLEMERRDAMFGALDPEVVGQPALCLTCEDYQEEVVEVDPSLRPRRHIALRGTLEEDGTLRGEMAYSFQGTRAVVVRSALRNRPDAEDRRQYFERILTDELEGAVLGDVRVYGEDDPHEEMKFTIEFERPRFARTEGDRLVVDRSVFQEAMQRIYATTATRDSALFVSYEREQEYELEIQLPAGRTASLRARDHEELPAEEGRYHRSTRVEEGVLRLSTGIFLPRQRVYPEGYGAFRQWATEVEESAALWLELR